MITIVVAVVSAHSHSNPVDRQSSRGILEPDFMIDAHIMMRVGKRWIFLANSELGYEEHVWF